MAAAIVAREAASKTNLNKTKYSFKNVTKNEMRDYIFLMQSSDSLPGFDYIFVLFGFYNFLNSLDFKIFWP